MNERKRFAVKTVTAAQCICELPSLEPYSAPALDFDVFIVAAGFEERVLAVPAKLRQDGVGVVGTIMVGTYRTNTYDNGQRYRQLEPLLQCLGGDRIEFDADSPLEVVTTIKDSLSRSGREHLRIAFDISGASSTLILAVVAALARSQNSIDLTVLYSSARQYDCQRQDNPESLVLQPDREQGVSDEPLSFPFGGYHHDHLPGSVIALPSMYTSRLEACLAFLNVGPITGSSDNLYWLLPSTGVEDHKWRQRETRKAVEDLMLRLQGRDRQDDQTDIIRPDDMISCDVLDYAETMRLLVARIDTLPARNISIVHMGSKLQAIGVSLAAAARDEVAVLTARPTSFNAQTYSSGIGDIYKLQFPDVASVVKQITDIGTVRVDNL